MSLAVVRTRGRGCGLMPPGSARSVGLAGPRAFALRHAVTGPVRQPLHCWWWVGWLGAAHSVSKVPSYLSASWSCMRRTLIHLGCVASAKPPPPARSWEGVYHRGSMRRRLGGRKGR